MFYQYNLKMRTKQEQIIGFSKLSFQLNASLTRFTESFIHCYSFVYNCYQKLNPS